MALQPFLGPWLLLQFRNLFYINSRTLGRVISPSQGRSLGGPYTYESGARVRLGEEPGSD
jgi:hypothetical protein